MTRVHIRVEGKEAERKEVAPHNLPIPNLGIECGTAFYHTQGYPEKDQKKAIFPEVLNS